MDQCALCYPMISSHGTDLLRGSFGHKQAMSTVTFVVKGAGSFEHFFSQWRWSMKTFQGVAPKSLRFVRVLLFEPGDIIAVGPHGFQRGLRAVFKGAIQREQFPIDDWLAPSVHQNVVQGPNELILPLSSLKQRQPD